LIVIVALCFSGVMRGQQAQTGAAVSTSQGKDAAATMAAGTSDQRGFVGDNACRACHQREFESYQTTRHHLDSALPSAETIHGHFDSGRNTMTSLDPGVSFRMNTKGRAFYETSFEGAPGHQKARTERIDIVVGSGKKGQTYLYWRGDELFEMPVSYWTSLDRWVNSPGYVDGTANFDRGINPRCLECHSTYFEEVNGSKPGFHFDKEHFVLGISCERCHGAGADHVRSHAGQTEASAAAVGTAKAVVAAAKMPAIGFERDRQVEICAQCHGGIGEGLTPAFSFKPGEALAPHISLESNPLARVDVHGNQVALLEKSRCFQSSPSMTCSTCHNPHEPEREAAAYSDKCLTCHQATACPTFSKMPTPAVTNCVDCHMPLQESNTLRVDLENQQVPIKVRNHWIRVYPSQDSPHQNSER
jgi:Cytochrome c554 and c-prime